MVSVVHIPRALDFQDHQEKMILNWIKGLYNFIFLLISINTWLVYQNQAYNGIWLFRHLICIQGNAFISKSQCFVNSEKWYKRIRCHIRKPLREMWIFKKIHTSKSIYRIVRLRVRSHGLSIRSLELHNSFFRIVYSSLELDNPLYRIANRSLDLNKAIQENGLYNSREQIAIRENGLSNLRERNTNLWERITYLRERISHFDITIYLSLFLKTYMSLRGILAT